MHSLRTKRKISRALMGRKLSAKHRKHIAEGLDRVGLGIGRKFSKKVRRKILKAIRNPEVQKRIHAPEVIKRITETKRIPNGICEACELPCRLNNDHNHRTGRQRGKVCSRCNFVIGLIKDSPLIAKKIYRYLEKYIRRFPRLP